MTFHIDKCVCCKKPIAGPQDFKDELSRKEFHLSGMCQSCQDEVFEKKPELIFEAFMKALEMAENEE